MIGGVHDFVCRAAGIERILLTVGQRKEGIDHLVFNAGTTFTSRCSSKSSFHSASVFRLFDCDFVSRFAIRSELTICDSPLQVKLKDMLYHTARISSIAWSPDSTRLATGSLDTNLLVWDVSKPASARQSIKVRMRGDAGRYALGRPLDDCDRLLGCLWVMLTRRQFGVELRFYWIISVYRRGLTGFCRL